MLFSFLKISREYIYLGFTVYLHAHTCTRIFLKNGKFLYFRFYETIKNQFCASLKSIKIDSCNFFSSKTKNRSFNCETIKPIIYDFKCIFDIKELICLHIFIFVKMIKCFFCSIVFTKYNLPAFLRKIPPENITICWTVSRFKPYYVSTYRIKWYVYHIYMYMYM